MKVHILRSGLAVSAAAFVFGCASIAQNKQTTVLDKVYTEDQAQRGAALYEAKCADCHDGDEPDAPPPRGADFVERWREAPVDFLYSFIRANMPGTAPGSLSEANYLDITAYLLHENKMPAGSAELTKDKLGTLLVGPGGPQPLPRDALVRVAGCLVAEGDEWALTSATEPVRVRTGDSTTPEEVAKSAAMPAGPARYRLANASDFHADTLKGQRVQAKGVYSKQGTTERVSVQSLERAGSGCK